MLAKTGLLIVSNPSKINKVLSRVQNQVKQILYIQLLTAISEPLGHFYPNIFNSWPKYSQTISGIYTHAARECRHLDVRVLLSGLKCNVKTIQTISPIDLVIFDKEYSQSDIELFLTGRIANINTECGVLTIPTEFEKILNGSLPDGKTYNHSVLGGTFDRLHNAHKMLLTETALRSKEKITVGVTEENMLASKTLCELIEPIDKRVNCVKEFLSDICCELNINVVPISDAFGPTKDDPTMELLVVSEETLKGGHKVNEVRASNNLAPLDVLNVELIDEPHPNPNEETKISSSTARMRLLGTLLKPVQAKNIPSRPYVIGLTGGIASGKSGVANWLSKKGALVVNCDLLAHDLYKPGMDCYNKIVSEFGGGVLSESGEIDRRKLGGIVFSNKGELDKLNGIVWPAIADKVMEIIKGSNAEVVVVEAAVLLTAKWEEMCHEVWTTVVPQSEAIHRLKTRNKLTEEDAIARINSQPANKYYVNNAHVVFCTLWPVEYTGKQVDLAWDLLQKRM